MKVAVVGSRSRTDRHAVEAAVQSLPADAIVVSGGCEGPDQWAVTAARGRGLRVVEHLPDLAGCKQHFEFTKAYHARNQHVVDDCDQVIAFVSDNRKGGTEDTIRRARKAGRFIDIR